MSEFNTTGPSFWQTLDDARDCLLIHGENERAQSMVSRLYEIISKSKPETKNMRQEVLDRFCDAYGLQALSLGEVVEESGLLTEPGAAIPGVSMVTCCMNRAENLLLALPSWLAADGIDEIVIVDWSSDTPVKEVLNERGFADSRINVVRVENEPRWILSYAFNVGFLLARFERILKVDSDIVLHPDFLRTNVLEDRSFIAGDWRDAGENQAFVNGFFYLARKDLLNINGFNEFITTYGWDDDDLYDRLVASGLTRCKISPNSVFHVEHDDVARVGRSSVKSAGAWDAFLAMPQTKIQANKILSELAPRWSKDQRMLAFQWETNALDEKVLRRAEAVPYPVDDGLRDNIDMLTAYRLVGWVAGPQVYGVSPEVLKAVISEHGFEAITQRKFQKMVKEAKLAAPSVNTTATKRFFIDAQHGLGNRMRAIGSGAAIAKNTGRELVIVWEPDDHCECRMSDLFDYSGEVIETNQLAEAKESNFSVYNYMEIEEGSQKDAPLDPNEKGDIYARSAYPLKSPHTSWNEENNFLKSLIPTQDVQDLLSTVTGPNDLSVHVRMVGGENAEHLSYETADNWTEEGHEQINHWRSKSHYSNFMKRIDALIEEGKCQNFFLAADNPKTYEEFTRAYGDRVQYLSREVYDRSKEQLLYALADAMLLSRSPLLLGSNWSSFTELAMRLSPHKMTLEMSGTDF